MRRRWPYLLVAAVLLGLGAYLTSGGETPKASYRPEVRMPWRPDEEDRARAQTRIGPQRKHPDPVPAPPPGAPPPRPTDPVFAAMPRDVKEIAMVVEANALRNSDLGEPLIACFTAGAPNALGRVRDAGFDPLTQLDRVSIFDGTLMLTGDFRGLNIDEVRAGSNSENTWQVWHDQVLLVGTQEEVQAAIDRLEGRVAPDEQPVLKDSMQYGEMYGLLKSDSFAKMFDDLDPRMAEFMRGAAQSVELHVDAMHDVGVVADVKGGDPRQVDELRRMMGGAIAAARAKAVAEGKPEAADVLDLSRVMAPTGDGKSFSLALGLPYDLLKKQLERCVEQGQKRQLERATRDAGEPTRSP